MGLERDHEAECYRTFKILGFCSPKNQDTTTCDNCHHKIHPRQKGVADYFAELKTNNEKYPMIPIKIECKANEDRFNMEKISVYQRHWMEKYIRRGGIGYVWLQLGDDRVNTKSVDARQVWLIPFNYFLASLVIMRKTYGFKYIPHYLKSGMRLKDSSMTANYLYSQFQCEWIPKIRVWRPNKLHSLWDFGLQVNYDTFPV